MAEEKIEEVEELISHIIGKNKKVVDTKVSRLTAPGENFISLALKVDYTIKNEENGTQEQLHAVAKVTPREDSFARQMYGDAYRNETSFYKVVLPTLQDFQRQQGDEETIDIFAKFLTSRPNLHGKSDEVDENSVILLENIAVLGYKNVDRLVGFDLETTKSFLKDLALFHAIPFALKRLNPEIYAKNIAPNLGAFKPPPGKEGEKEFTFPHEKAVELLEESEELSEHLLEKIKSCIKFVFPGNEPDGFYSSISHGDMWVNNIMNKFEDGRPIKNKLVDFQVYMERSVALDLLFFLFTSVQLSVLEKSLDDLLRLYYDHFIRDLDKLKYDTSSFTFEHFLEEIRRVIKIELGHAVAFIYFVVCSRKGEQRQSDDDLKRTPFETKDNVTPEGRKKVVFIVKEVIRRGWLD